METNKTLTDCYGNKIGITDNVELLEKPFGNWEIDNTEPSTGTLYLVNGPGTIICSSQQVRKIIK